MIRLSEQPAHALSQLNEQLATRFLVRYLAESGFVRDFARMKYRHRATIRALRDFRSPPPWYAYGIDWQYIASQGDYGNDSIVAAYVADVRQLAEKWSLNRFANNRGYEALWCLSKANTRRSRAFTLSNAGRQMHEIPPINGERGGRLFIGRVRGIRRFRHDPPQVDEVQRGQTFTVRVNVESSWDPWSHPPADVEDRIVALCRTQIREWLALQSALTTESGFRFPGAEPMNDDYIDWTFRRFVLLEHYTDIAKDVFKATGLVRNKTTEMARRTGFAYPKTRKRTVSE